MQQTIAKLKETLERYERLFDERLQLITNKHIFELTIRNEEIEKKN